MAQHDAARGGHFTVQDRRELGGKMDYNLRAYDQHGRMIMHMWDNDAAEVERTRADLLRRGCEERPYIDPIIRTA